MEGAGRVGTSRLKTERYYDEWMQSFDACPVLTIRTDDLDFVHKKKHMDIVLDRIKDTLAGREEVIFD